jgi:hypothetical protein
MLVYPNLIILGQLWHNGLSIIDRKGISGSIVDYIQECMKVDHWLCILILQWNSKGRNPVLDIEAVEFSFRTRVTAANQ